MKSQCLSRLSSVSVFVRVMLLGPPVLNTIGLQPQCSLFRGNSSTSKDTFNIPVDFVLISCAVVEIVESYVKIKVIGKRFMVMFSFM